MLGAAGLFAVLQQGQRGTKCNAEDIKEAHRQQLSLQWHKPKLSIPSVVGDES